MLTRKNDKSIAKWEHLIIPMDGGRLEHWQLAKEIKMIRSEEITEISNEEALDILVAEQVIGWQLEKDEAKIKRLNEYLAHREGRRWWRMPNGGWYHKPPAYSTDIAAAWQIVDCLNTQGYKLCLSQGDFENHASFVLDGKKFDYLTGTSIPEAICKAALQVVSNSAPVSL
jgi:hypothetical protein